MSQSLERFLAGFHSTRQWPVTTSSSVAIPRKVPRRFPLDETASCAETLMSQSLERFLAGFHRTYDIRSESGIDMSQSLERFLAGFHLTSRPATCRTMSQSLERFLAGFHPGDGSDCIGSTCITSQSLERFLAGFHPGYRSPSAGQESTCRNPSKGSSPVSTQGDDADLEPTPDMSQSLERFLAGFHKEPTTSRTRRVLKMSQSLERFLAGFHPGEDSRFLDDTFQCRNPSKGSSPVSTRIAETNGRGVVQSQSLERFLAGFHSNSESDAGIEQWSQSLERFLAGFHGGGVGD